MSFIWIPERNFVFLPAWEPDHFPSVVVFSYSSNNLERQNVACGVLPALRAAHKTLGKFSSWIPSHHWGLPEFHSPDFRVIIRSSHIFLKGWIRAQVPPQELCCSAPQQNTEAQSEVPERYERSILDKNLQSKLNETHLYNFRKRGLT